MQISLAGTTIELLPQRAIFLPETAVLILGDLHLGKAMHFRKAGIFMPPQSAYKDYETLHLLIQKHQPQHVYFLGDLFHSHHNSEWNQLTAFIGEHPQTMFTLIKGNHDILKAELYRQHNINVIEKALIIDNLIFSHEPLKTLPEGMINVAGHIHPGCVIRSGGRQSLRLPCFYFKDNLLLLPAFGHLTGLQILDRSDAEVFVVFPDKVMVL
ncbi:ligase-associated DNA damage response endonuclease PdeM [Taibaiella lutea]|uniref:Ligase-associated DNA damage response endonuclease PdeM n=1 Tax=Taibaiella lutea TaxID=2608001 RepID=A0A5M6CAU9_9BACT|nr:ligase-associated DNA damage response endonuclease PdeM [Taibaiella lutea]KAA5532297.1 ligase-associated DNA damage response endonuclease PdeM [Taibaiella lutea]